MIRLDENEKESMNLAVLVWPCCPKWLFYGQLFFASWLFSYDDIAQYNDGAPKKGERYQGITETVVRRCSIEIGVLKNFTKFIGKHLCESLLFNACNFIKREALAHVFSYEFCEIFKKTYFTEHLRTTANIFLLRKIIKSFS